MTGGLIIHNSVDNSCLDTKTFSIYSYFIVACSAVTGLGRFSILYSKHYEEGMCFC